MKIVYFGDSITAGFNELQNHSNVINMGISGNKINNLIGRIEQVLLEKPDRIIIMIGINDYLNMKSYWGSPIQLDIAKLYQLLIELLQNNLPNAEILCISILPVSMDIDENLLEQYNRDIISLNKDIKALCSDTKIAYVDIHSVFLINNKLETTMTNDGVHLNSKGYQKYYNSIKKYLVE